MPAHSRAFASIVCSGLLLAAPTALAAGYIKFDGVQGEAKGRAASPGIEIDSFSWGASNAGSSKRADAAPAATVPDEPTAAASRGGGAGKVSMQDLSVTGAVSTRDAASGLPTGKRQHKPVADVTGDGRPDVVAAAPVDGALAEFSFTAASGDSANGGELARACAGGKHFDEVVITTGGKRYRIQDFAVTSCEPASAGRQSYRGRGHVTLLK